MSARAPTGFPAARLAVFAALAAFAAAHWLSLLSDPPVARAALALAAVSAGACLLAAIERAGPGPWRAAALAAAVAGASAAAALIAMGLPASMLFPGGWGELGAGVDRGLQGLSGDVDFPYAGGEQWSRLVLLGGLACLLALGAALAFWPRRRAGSGARIAGLAILVAIYAAAAAMRSGAESLLTGLALLLMVAAWLWLPGLGRRAALGAGAAVAALGVLALPAAAGLDGGKPWVDYRDWQLAAPADARSYNWDHTYGPLRQREGTPLLDVRSNAPRYWRTAVLDRFDGYNWERSRVDVGQPSLELPTEVDRDSPAGAPDRLNPDWLVRTEFTLRQLRSEFAIAPGALRAADGIELDPTPNGSTLIDGGTLAEGDSYTTLSYAPDPSAAQMRGAPNSYAPALARHTAIGLPRRNRGPSDPPEQFEPPVQVPLRGGPALARSEQAARRLAGSRYGGILALAERVTAGTTTTYDQVKALEVHLQSNYDYFEDVPHSELPLRAFLFEQRRGYCQQFSGTMTLMLRMLGIPARVATGFSPGSRDPARPGRFRVRDLDAHSWTEVYFTGIGWVPFDPTPTAAPAELQAGGLGFASAARGSGEPAPAQAPDAAAAEEPAQAAGPGSSGRLPLWPFALALALPLAAALATAAARVLRHRSLSTAEAAEDRARELASALDRLGWGLPRGVTLPGLEYRFRASRRRAAAGYAGKLVAIRFADGDGPLPSRSERRRMRRELPRLRGWRAILDSFRAIPPGAPRRQATRIR